MEPIVCLAIRSLTHSLSLLVLSLCPTHHVTPHVRDDDEDVEDVEYGNLTFRPGL